MPVAMSSEPASTLGHSMIVGIRSSSSAISVSQIWSLPWPYSVVTGCWLTSRNGLRDVDVRAHALAVEPLGVRHAAVRRARSR